MSRLLSVLVLALVAAAIGVVALLAPVRAQDRDPTKRDLDTYRLRVGDEVEIVVYTGTTKLEPDLKRTLIVPGNGDVSFPPAGKIHLLDRTVFEIQETVAQKLKDTSFLTNPIVGCVVTRYEPRVVYLIGATMAQLELPVHKNLRILEVLAKAGSLALSRSVGAPDFTRVTIRRMGSDGRPFPVTVNVDEILFKGKEEQNILIFEGDIIYVPPAEEASPLSSEWVYVLGKVKNPGRHPVLKGRTAFTLTKLIAMVGDFQEFANRTKVKIIRTTATGREPFEIDFDDIIDGKRPDFELRADDLIYVPENWI